MAQKFSKLFEPITIGKLTIKNRIAMAPMFILKMTNPDGSPTQRALDFYIERARGGVGLIISGAHKIENTIEVANVGFPFISPEVVTPYGELCDTLHSLGTKFVVQCTAGMGRVGKFVDNIPVCASAVPHQWRPDITCRPLGIEEIEKIVEAFGQAAEILVAASVDGMELHGHEGYIFDQFATPLWNKRTDKYGGSLEARLRFPVEALQKIKQRAGKNFHVQYRYGLKHFLKGPYKGGVPGEVFEEAGRDIEEGIAMAKIFEQAGFNALHIDAGAKSCPYWGHPAIYQEHGCLTDLAAQVKKAVKIPVITVGKVNIPELAERVIAEGKADLIAMARGLLADPYWPMKVREGKEEEIRPCITCGDGCTGRVNHAKPMSCAVNPACGRERIYQLVPAEKPKKLMVVGGGIAGMEVARVAATRGHRVTLFEKGESLGGHLIEAAVPDFKRDVRRLLKWYERQLSKLGIEIKFRTEVSTALVGKEKPDAVCVATGSKPVIPDLPGIKKSHVMTCVDALLGKGKIGSEVAVVGGGLIGCETALWLAQQGKKVTILEMLPQLMSTRYHPDYNRVMLLDLLEHLQVAVLTGVRVQEIIDTGVILLDPEGQRREVKADTVILAVGLKPDDTLYKLLAREAAEVHAIGDCQEPINVMKAIWDAYEVGRCI